MFSSKLLKKYWLVLILVVMTLTGFTLFKVKSTDIWNIQGITVEGTSLFACIVGYLYIMKLRIRNLDIGWGLFTIGMFVHFLSQFINQPVIVNVEVRGILAILGLVLIADGFYKAFTREKKIEEILKESEEKYRTTFEHTGTAMAILEEDTTISLVNSQFENLFGYSKEEIEGKMSWTKFVHPDELKRMIGYHKKRRENPDEVLKEYEFRAIDRNGNILNMLLNIDLIPRTKKSVISVIDITERKRMEEKLIYERKLLQALMDKMPDSIYFKDKKNRFIRVNKAKAEHYHTTPEDMVGKTDFDFLPENQAKESFADDSWVIKTGKAIKDKVEKITHKNGIERWIFATKVPQYNEKGEIIGTIGISRDITERKKVEERIKNLNALYRDLVKAVNESKSIGELSQRILRATSKVIYYDMGSVSVYDAEKKILIESAQIGYPKELEEGTLKQEKVEKGGKGVATLSALYKKPVYIDNLKEYKLTSYIYELIKKFDLQEMYTLPLITRGELHGVLQIIVKLGKTLSREDRELLDTVSEEIAAGMAKIKAEEKLRELVIRDYLTGLYNHRYFYQRLEEEKNRSKRYGEAYSLLYLDIDNFKACNDTYGHLKGDRVLRALSKILQNNLREVDSAYRYGGEEFVVLLPSTYKEQAKQVANRIRERTHSELYSKCKITVSIGVADSRAAEDVVEAADRAMYGAKREGKNKIKIAL